MTRIFHVGAGSGGMTVLDSVCRDPRISHVTLVEPDVYKPHNVIRHLFPITSVGKGKGELAAAWLQDRLPDLSPRVLACDLLDRAYVDTIDHAVAQSDIGICAADNEPAKFHFDALMRRHRKPWTLGEVLAGGIGGLVHWFVPGGPCYGCVATFLRRTVTAGPEKPPDYARPGGPVAETAVPASRASIQVIASLHAQVTLQLLGNPDGYSPGFTSMLFTLETVPAMFEEAFRMHRFQVPRSPNCLICQDTVASGDLDRAVDEALERLNQP